MYMYMYIEISMTADCQYCSQNPSGVGVEREWTEYGIRLVLMMVMTRSIG
jgi:hypothetical protein